MWNRLAERLRRSRCRGYLHLNLFHSKQIAEQHPVFIDRLRSNRRDPPVCYRQLVARRVGSIDILRLGKDSKDRVGVADIKNKKHKQYSSENVCTARAL